MKQESESSTIWGRVGGLWTQNWLGGSQLRAVTSAALTESASRQPPHSGNSGEVVLRLCGAAKTMSPFLPLCQ